ncbi:ABC transporter substrate-binding protein [Pelagibacterium flavum]|uniref:ABC transporter substrate-binding protein n=1 Tax=Pelagibacterium flavum TaxID=2984530 RepID=A0ABY6ITA5_9HYPH|nr:ABC transporter substrate-binding protein [Pelagibacterium sp. YIM 151497]UYQ73866.1 ABC transporter substrate-binding protein [Pelagibacterium sp. YIM 151497]|tara:strand:+ start:1791 stop:3005 length:1215 start_codon:yes stop_codon:yes gene_type:complete
MTIGMFKRGANRRDVIKGIAATATFTLAAPAILRAQESAIHIGTLTPLTGAGGPYGPVMADAVRKVVDEVNAAGVLGREIILVSEDSQTSPEAAVRAARKLIDVDNVSAIIGTWASAVTTAVAPMAWESERMLFTVSGADSITQLPHNGYIIRTQPNTTLQGQKFGEYAVELGDRRVFFLTPQTPFADSQYTTIKAAVEAAGGEVERLIYDDKKPSLRSELDQALRFDPDMLILGGYTPDTTVLLRDIYRAGYEGHLLGFAYSINQDLIGGLPAEVVEGAYTLAPSPAEGGTAYDRLAGLVGIDVPDTYTCQVYDHINLALMAIAHAGGSSGTEIRDSVREVSQGGGMEVDNAVAGIEAILAGEKVDYAGASGPCEFNEIGDITDASFRYEQVVGGAIELLKIA